jgi:chloride channel protein, CIC family
MEKDTIPFKILLNATPENLFKNSIFSSVQDNQWILLGLLGLLIAFKVFAMAITTGAGGIGGTFAPTLFVGGISGFFVGKILNLAFNTNLSESNFALVGMAGNDGWCYARSANCNIFNCGANGGV